MEELEYTITQNKRALGYEAEKIAKQVDYLQALIAEDQWSDFDATIAYGGNMTFCTQILTGDGAIYTRYTGNDFDEARHQFTTADPVLVKEHWILVNGQVSHTYHKRYVGAPSWVSLPQETRQYLASIGINEKA